MAWFNPFARRKPHPLPPTQLLGCDDWHVGDIAECVNTGPWFGTDGLPAPSGPQHLECLRVAHIRMLAFPLRGIEIQLLGFTRFGAAGFAAAMFRKVTPHADATTAADAAFCAGLRNITPPAETETASCAVLPTAGTFLSHRLHTGRGFSR